MYYQSWAVNDTDSILLEFNCRHLLFPQKTFMQLPQLQKCKRSHSRCPQVMMHYWRYFLLRYSLHEFLIAFQFLFLLTAFQFRNEPQSMSQSIHSSHCTEGLSVFWFTLIKNHETFADSCINFNRKMSCTWYFGDEQTECAVKPTTVVVTNEFSKNTSICEVGSIMVHTGGVLMLCNPGVGIPLLQLSQLQVSLVGNDNTVNWRWGRQMCQSAFANYIDNKLPKTNSIHQHCLRYCLQSIALAQENQAGTLFSVSVKLIDKETPEKVVQIWKHLEWEIPVSHLLVVCSVLDAAVFSCRTL